MDLLKRGCVLGIIFLFVFSVICSSSSHTGTTDGSTIIPSHIMVCFIFKFIFRQFAELLKVTISFVISVSQSACPHGTTQHPLDGFS
jgi:hypothetical protein